MWKKLTHIKKILVPVDLTDSSLCAVDSALSFAKAGKSQIYILHVLTKVMNRNRLPSEQASTARIDPASKDYADLELFFQEKIKQRSDLVYIIRSGMPSKEILTFAREEGVDLIIMSVCGQSDPGGPHQGGVAQEIIRNALVPVVIVKPDETVRKLLDLSLLQKMQEEKTMTYDEKYLQEIRQRVCMKCIDRTASGICVTAKFDACAINRFLPEIIDIVKNTKSDSMTDYVSQLRSKVCAVCEQQSPDGVCEMRDDLECALDRYFPLVVDAIQEVESLKKL